MTETEWLACVDSLRMLQQAGVGQKDRKVIWVIVACFRRQWSSLPSSCREWVHLQEAIADGQADLNRFDEAWESVESELSSLDWNESSDHSPGSYHALLMLATGGWLLNSPLEQGNEHWLVAETAHASIIRDIFGNPFRPALLSPSWLAWNDATIPKMAQSIYDSRAFDRLPLLADALEDAGCTDADILTHCRGGGEHVRGCWVLDLLLGKQ